VVRRFVAEGGRVLFCGLNAVRGQEVAAEFSRNEATFLRADVGDEKDVEALVSAVVRNYGRLDVLVNNAARGVAGAVTRLATSDWRRSTAVNLDSVFFACRAAIPVMQANGGGAIVNIASISGLAGDGAYPSYCAQKAAVVNLTRAMAVCHARDDVRINAVCPGFVETPATSGFGRIEGLREAWRSRIPSQRFGKPEDIAGVVAFLASSDADYMHGSIVVVDGGMSAATGQPTEQPFNA
jgi:meso-butanediol dehydrogenase / (S,S)-butanediol dehydrogenase / diacetyl reductase